MGTQTQLCLGYHSSDTDGGLKGTGGAEKAQAPVPVLGTSVV